MNRKEFVKVAGIVAGFFILVTDLLILLIDQDQQFIIE